MIDAAEVAKHDSAESCWVIIEGQVYDVTDFLNDHPGGAQSILRLAGQDATRAYEPIHPKGTLDTLPPEKHLGPVDPTTIHSVITNKIEHKHLSNNKISIPASVCQNLDDIEAVARQKLSREAWVYYSSAADSLASLNTNRNDWSKISFRPRILRNVRRANMKRKVMNHESSLPIFIAPAARAKLGHPDGEKCLADGAAEANIVYCASRVSSVAHDELATSFTKYQGGGALVFQLYVPKQKEGAVQLIKMAKRLGCKALVVTVDSNVIGRREEDDRLLAEIAAEEKRVVPRNLNLDNGEDGEVLRAMHDPTLEWYDIHWIKKLWNQTGPIFLKGIQTAEDAYEASKIGVDGIYLSNHGGRQLDCAPSSIRTLLEIRKFYPAIMKTMEVYLDGGVRRGTDVVKALCLGARAVGLGRPFHYGLSAYGTDGVLRVMELLSDEIQTTMRLLGVTDVDQLNPSYVNTKLLENELPDQLADDIPHRAKL